MMATVHREGDGFRFVVKGAPERVLAACARAREDETEFALDDGRRERILARGEALARSGQRVLAVAQKASRDAMEHPYESLAFVGLVGLVDPPREEVRGAIEACRRAGVRIAMVTGDQPATARYVARAVHLVDDEEPETVDARSLSSVESSSKQDKARLAAAAVVARATPKQKLDLIATHREAGHVVAMLGDGVNDAPALRAADIGVAMGKRGTAVARQAADMVLEDDQLMTIVVAIREGRIIFDNIRKFVVYLLSCNLSEILAVGIAAAVGAILPLTALQILFLNLVTDVFPALALAGGEGDATVMSRPPRARDEPVLTRRHFAYVAGYGVLLTASVLGALAVARVGLSMESRDAVTISFLAMGFGQLAHVFNMASPRSGAFVNEVTRNAAVWGAVALCTALLLLTLYLPPLRALLHTSAPSAMGWLLVAVFSLAPLVVGRVASLGARAAMRADERRAAGRIGSTSGAAAE
jgi:Ca2+-transporting ATPase